MPPAPEASEPHESYALLRSVAGPADLRRLSPDQLPDLAGEIRAFLIDQVSQTGGHLGPNLGVVELTIALHRVFESPDDPIIFDTGHQSYVHKMLTGRLDAFPDAAAEGRPVGLPEPGGVRARLGGELARVGVAVVRGRARPRSAADREVGHRRGPGGRRGADRRDGLGGAQQHRRRRRPAAGHPGQRQRALLHPDGRRPGPPPLRSAHQPALRAGARAGPQAGQPARRCSGGPPTTCCTASRAGSRTSSPRRACSPTSA